MEKHLPGQETSKTQIQKWMCQLLCKTSISGVKLPHLLFSLVKLCIILIFSNLWKVKWSKCKWFMAWGLFVSFNKSVSLFVSEKGRAVWNSWYVFKVSFKEYFFFLSSHVSQKKPACQTAPGSSSETETSISVYGLYLWSRAQSPFSI